MSFFGAEFRRSGASALFHRGNPAPACWGPNTAASDRPRPCPRLNDNQINDIVAYFEALKAEQKKGP